MDPSLHLCSERWAIQLLCCTNYIWARWTEHHIDLYHVVSVLACVCMLRCMFITNIVTVSAPVSLQEYGDSYEDAAYDMQPLNCSTTESIKGGQVTYSQVKHNTLDSGAEMIGWFASRQKMQLFCKKHQTFSRSSLTKVRIWCFSLFKLFLELVC